LGRHRLPTVAADIRWLLENDLSSVEHVVQLTVANEPCELLGNNRPIC
jgi:hypothetical protein